MNSLFLFFFGNTHTGDSSTLAFHEFAMVIISLVNSEVYERLTGDLRREHIKLIGHIFESVCGSKRSDTVVTVREAGIALSLFCGGPFILLMYYFLYFIIIYLLVDQNIFLHINMC